MELSRVEIRYACQAPQEHARSQSAPLEPSVLLFHKPHQTDGRPAIRRAAALGCKRVNIVATMFTRINENQEVLEYGMVRRGQFEPLDSQQLEVFRNALYDAFAEATTLGMDISLLAHLNSWGENSEWRNYFRFDPLREYRGYTYQEAVIAPILEALAEAEVPLNHVELSLCGEMGTSVFSHPESYRQIVRAIRRQYPTTPPSLGISLNFHQVAGKAEPTVEASQAVESLIDECDFLGLSNYHWFELPVEVSDFTQAVDDFLKELGAHGVTVSREKPLHFSEVGIGGYNEAGKIPASPAEAAKAPWQGTTRNSRDPWKTPAMRQLRVDYHRSLLTFLQQQPATHRVTQAFLWSEGSWDPMDVSGDGFADETILEMIQRHNASNDSTE